MNGIGLDYKRNYKMKLRFIKNDYINKTDVVKHELVIFYLSNKYTSYNNNNIHFDYMNSCIKCFIRV